MIKYLFTALLIVLGGFSQAQVNQVRNASFEQKKGCPVNADQIRLANYWTDIDTVSFIVTSGGDTLGSPYCSPDYINTCASDNFFSGAPANSWFFQYPRTGNGMAQVNMFFDESFSAPYKRDYLQGRFYTQLTAGKSYCVTFFVNFSGTTSPVPCMYAVDHIGAYLDNGTIDGVMDTSNCGLPHPEYVPQVYTTTIITDTLNWTKVQGNFVATGTEKFITIGNFFHKVNTNYISYTPSGGIPFSYYLVDDVSVIESTESAHAGPDVAITAGDSVHIGTDEEGMPCTWYVAGDTTAVGYSGGIWVKPDTTTTYVVEMDLCGNVTRDSVTVSVWAVGLSVALKMTEPIIWPNPVRDELHVDNAAGSVLVVYDVVGREVYRATLAGDRAVVQMASLEPGIYVVQVVDARGGRIVKRVVKE